MRPVRDKTAATVLYNITMSSRYNYIGGTPNGANFES